jgi:hypothetical protein
MFSRLFVVLAMLGLSACATARGELVLPNQSHLKSHATHAVDLEVGPFGLALGRWIMGRATEGDPDAAAVRDALKACKSVRIRSYEFDSDFEYPQDDIDSIRSQLARPGWSQLATVRDRKKRENVDVYIALEDEKIYGLVVLASGPRELTIVNVVGAFGLDQIDRLRTHFTAQARRRAVPDEAPPPPNL